MSATRQAPHIDKPVERRRRLIARKAAAVSEVAPQALMLAACDPTSAVPQALIALQRRYGNRALRRLIQTERSPGPASGVIQRVPEPAIVHQATGLHKSDRQQVAPGGLVTPERGAFSAKIKIPVGSQITVDYAQPVTDANFSWATHQGRVGYVKKARINKGVQIGASTLFSLQPAPGHLRIYDMATSTYLTQAAPSQAQQIGASTFYSFPMTPALFRIYDIATNQYLTDAESNMMEAGIRGVMGHLLQSEVTTGLDIQEKEKILRQLIKQAKLPGGQLPNPQQWQQATANIQAKIMQRVNTDHAQLVTAGLISNAHQLKRVRFSGADFHKHAQAPVFLTFETNNPLNPDPRKVVYKPSNLALDARLFGTAHSLAHSLDTTGTQISQYTILAREDVHHEKYGFMQFVETGGPATAAQLLGVYESLAANMALSYLVGLEDVHQENVLLLNDRVQVIDMEATTGIFTKRRTPALDTSEGGFKSQLWIKALNEGIGPKLKERAANGQLQAAPSTPTAVDHMKTTFMAVLRKAKGAGFNADWLTHTQALRGMHSRFVPIPTEDFNQMITPAQDRANQAAWTAYVNGDPGDPNHNTPATAEGAWLVNQARSKSGASADFTRRVMTSLGTYNALCRGEVPYYTRDLSRSDRILDEAGHQIPVNPGDISKIGGAIDVEMNARRAELQGSRTRQSDVYAIFKAQIISIIQALNDDLLNTLGG